MALGISHQYTSYYLRKVKSTTDTLVSTAHTGLPGKLMKEKSLLNVLACQ